MFRVQSSIRLPCNPLTSWQFILSSISSYLPLFPLPAYPLLSPLFLFLSSVPPHTFPSTHASPSLLWPLEPQDSFLKSHLCFIYLPHSLPFFPCPFPPFPAISAPKGHTTHHHHHTEDTPPTNHTHTHHPNFTLPDPMIRPL